MGEQASVSPALFVSEELLEEAPWDFSGPKVTSLKQRHKKSDFQLIRPGEHTTFVRSRLLGLTL